MISVRSLSQAKKLLCSSFVFAVASAIAPYSMLAQEEAKPAAPEAKAAAPDAKPSASALPAALPPLPADARVAQTIQLEGKTLH